MCPIYKYDLFSVWKRLNLIGKFSCNKLFRKIAVRSSYSLEERLDFLSNVLLATGYDRESMVIFLTIIAQLLLMSEC
jgi:hypothetical protein